MEINLQDIDQPLTRLESFHVEADQESHQPNFHLVFSYLLFDSLWDIINSLLFLFCLIKARTYTNIQHFSWFLNEMSISRRGWLKNSSLTSSWILDNIPTREDITNPFRRPTLYRFYSNNSLNKVDTYLHILHFESVPCLN